MNDREVRDPGQEDIKRLYQLKDVEGREPWFVRYDTVVEELCELIKNDDLMVSPHGTVFRSNRAFYQCRRLGHELYRAGGLKLMREVCDRIGAAYGLNVNPIDIAWDGMSCGWKQGDAGLTGPASER